MVQTGTRTRRGQPERTTAWAEERQRTKRIAIPLTPEEEQSIRDHVENTRERSMADFIRRAVFEKIGGVVAGVARAAEEAPEFVRLAWDKTTRSLVEAANARADAAAELVRKMLGEIWALRKVEEQVKVLLDPKATPAAQAAARREIAGNLAVLERMPREEYVK